MAQMSLHCTQNEVRTPPCPIESRQDSCQLRVEPAGHLPSHTGQLRGPCTEARLPPSAALRRSVHCGVALHPQFAVSVVPTCPDPAEIYLPKHSPMLSFLIRMYFPLPIRGGSVRALPAGPAVKNLPCNAGDLVRELRSHGATKSEHRNYQAPTPWPESLCSEDPTCCSQKIKESINEDFLNVFKKKTDL